MHNFSFCQPVGKPGEFFSDIVYNYTLKNKQGQWFSSHFFGTAKCSILRVSGGFVPCTPSPPRGLCPEPAEGHYRAFTVLCHSKTGQQLFQRSWLTGLELFSASQSTKRRPRFPVNIERFFGLLDSERCKILKGKTPIRVCFFIFIDGRYQSRKEMSSCV